MSDDEIDFNSELDSLIGTGIARHSSEVLKNNLAQVQLRAEEAQKQQNLLIARNNEIRSKLDALRKRADNDEDKNKSAKNALNDENLRNEVETLRKELQQLRSQTDEDREQINNSSLDTDADDAVSREIELQAALQAERQQAALMRKALEERDKALEDLTNQCQTLEDDLEDREREMDHLTREIEQVKSEPSKSDGDMFGNKLTLSMPERGAIHNAADISELFQPEANKRGKKILSYLSLIGKGIGITLGVGLVGMIMVLMWPQVYKILFTSTPKPIVTTITSPPIAPNETVIKNPQITIKTLPKVATTSVIPSNLPKIRDNLRSGGQGPQMVQLPAGQFFMGSKPLYGGSIERDEQPYHPVTIKTFFIASYETSFEEYEQFTRTNNRPMSDDAGFGKGNHPVINVNWEEAKQYTEWLSTETGLHYYLPSEAQWEYAARGGTISRYWWSNSVEPGKAVCFACGTPWDNRSTAPVGSLTPNAFGLYDTSGNVMEWLQDCYNRNYNDAPNDGSPWLTGDCSQRLVRGGAFNKPMSATRNSARFRLPIESRFNALGFRVARD